MFYVYLKWLEALPISIKVRESLWLFPALESVHIYSMILLVSIFSIFDFRLLGFTLDKQSPEPLSRLSGRLLRWGWFCFGINLITGTLLFSSEAVKMSGNWAFGFKMGFIFFALIIHSLVLRRAVRWDGLSVMPVAAKFAGGLSLLLWVGVITMSRWIAFISSSLLLK